MGPRLGACVAAALLLAPIASTATLPSGVPAVPAEGPAPPPGPEADPEAPFLADVVRSPVTGRPWSVYKTDTASWVRHGDARHPGLAAAFRAEHLALPPEEQVLRKLSPALRAAREAADPGTVRVFATLAEQPLVDLAPGVWARHAPELEGLRARLRADPQDRASAEALERGLAGARAELLAAARDQMGPPQAHLAAEARARGWDVLGGGSLVNDLLLWLPASELGDLAADPRVARVDEDALLRAALDVAPADLRAEDVWEAGQDGASGTFDLAVLDTGVDGAHPAFAGKNVTAKVFHDAAEADGCYDDDAGTTDDLHGHGTSVHSIAASGHATYHGSAKGAPSIVHGKAGWRVGLLCLGGGAMYDSDGRKAANWSLTQLADPAEGVNLSFGSLDCAATDGDTGFERFFDAVSFALDVPVTIAAGNDGPDSCTTGSPCDAFNVLCVGNVDDRNTADRGDNAIAGSSSRGPSGDGRRKPDLSAPGTRLRSANALWEDEADWVDFTGTSMAAPIALGVATLLQHGGVAGAKEVKALLLATAQRSAPYAEGMAHGFGYLDAKRAWDHRGHVRSGSAGEGANQLYRLGGADALALVWQRHMTWKGADPPGATPLPITDLDLQVWDEADHSLDLNETEAQDYHGGDVGSAEPVARVRAVSLASGVASEAFALAATGPITGPFAPPGLSLEAQAPSSAASGEAFNVSAQATNTGELRAHGVRLQLNLPAACSTPGANPRILAPLAGGATGSASWSVSCTSGSPTLEVVADTQARQYGVSAPRATRTLALTVSTGPPSVALVEPAAGSVLGPSLAARADATDDEAVAEVSAQLDGGAWQAMACTGPAASKSCTRAYAGLANGAHTLRARACDSSQLCTTTPERSFTVQNAAPSVLLTAPAEGAWLGASFQAAAEAQDDLGLASVRVRVDEGAWQAMDCAGNATSQACTKDLSGVAEGARQLTPEACDAAPVCTLGAPRGVVVDSTPPTVGVARPAAGAVVVGDAEVARLPVASHAVVLTGPRLTVRASASDAGPPGAAVASVQFTLGGRTCTATAPPFECAIPLGGFIYSGSLVARATDRAGNTAQHARPVVVVS